MERKYDSLSLLMLVFVICMALVLLWGMAISKDRVAMEATYGDVVVANGGCL